MRRVFPAIIVFAFLALGGIFLLSAKNRGATPPTQLPTAYELFWGDGCPHCAKVEEFLVSWENKDKIIIDKKEVWKDRANAEVMSQRAASCKIPTAELGVPFLYAPEGKCFVGDSPIIDYFKNLKP